MERDSVVWFLERFRDGDQSDPAWRIFIVETFLQAAYLYDDGRLLLHLNFGGKNNTVTLKVAEQVVSEGEALCSSFSPSGAPNDANLNRQTVYFLDGLFVAVSFAKAKRAEE